MENKVWISTGVVYSCIQQTQTLVCTYTKSTNGTSSSQLVQYTCPSTYVCCGSDCCAKSSWEGNTHHFYQLWYFWLSLIFVLAICFGSFAGYYKKRLRRNTVVTIHPTGYPTQCPPPDRLFFPTNRHAMSRAGTSLHPPGMATPLGVHSPNTLAPISGIGLDEMRTPSPYHGTAKDLEPYIYPAYGHRSMLTPMPDSTLRRNSTMETRTMFQPIQPAYEAPGPVYSSGLNDN